MTDQLGSPEGGARSPRPVSRTAERAQRDRQDKLDNIEEQVRRGTLVIRQMTQEERLLYPVQAGEGKRARRR